VGVFLSDVHQDGPTTCVVGSLREIPTRQYQAAARKKPCKGNVPRGLVEGFKLFVPSLRHADHCLHGFAEGSLQGDHPILIETDRFISSVNHGVGRLCELALTVLGEHRNVPYRDIQRQLDKPAEQQIIAELLHQLPLRAHRLEGLQQQRAKQLLRSD
jgi:hypothetical protein